MNRKEALFRLKNMFDIGFSYLNVREFVNDIYDSLEGKREFVGGYPKVTNRPSSTPKVNKKPSEDNIFLSNREMVRALEEKDRLVKESIKRQMLTKEEENILLPSKAKPLKDPKSLTREQRDEYVKSLIAKDYNIKSFTDFSYDLFHTSLGKMKYFPKSDKIQRCKTNDWRPNGLVFIINNLKYLK